MQSFLRILISHIYYLIASQCTVEEGPLTWLLQYLRILEYVTDFESGADQYPLSTLDFMYLWPCLVGKN